MYRILFKLGPINIYSYGFMLAMAFLFGTLVAIRLAKQEGISAEKVLELMIYIIISALIGARLGYVLFFWWQFSHNPLLIFSFSGGGLAFYGGLFLALFVVLWRAKVYKIPILKIFDIGSAPVFLGYSIARIGCFLNGCCYGIETNLPWAVKFPNLPGMRHPTQIYASIITFGCFLFILYLWKKKKFDGQVFLTALILYMTYRFFIEFIRVGPKVLFGLTSVQVISVFVFAAAISTLIWKFRKT